MPAGHWPAIRAPKLCLLPPTRSSAVVRVAIHRGKRLSSLSWSQRIPMPQFVRWSQLAAEHGKGSITSCLSFPVASTASGRPASPAS